VTVTRKCASCDEDGVDVNVFFEGGEDVICLRRLAARSEIVMVMSLPSSSVRGFCRITVAWRGLVVENCRLDVRSEDGLRDIGM